MTDPIDDRRVIADPGGQQARHGAAAVSGGTVEADPLTRRVARGAVYVTGGRLVTQALQFAMGLVLARLLLPSDFGLIATVYTVQALVGTLFEFGLASSLIQSSGPTERDRSTVFWLNALSGVCLLAILTAVSPLAADFFDMPQLTTLMPVTALSFVCNQSVVHFAMMQRAMRLPTVALIDIVASSTGFAVMLACALQGAGALSLAVGLPTTSAVASVLYFAVVRWRPHHFISLDSVRRVWGFSSGILGFSLVRYITQYVDNLLIGRSFGATSLGLYSRAYNLMLLPVNQVVGGLGSVLFPALSAIKDDKPRAGQAYERCLRLVVLVAAPALAGLAATSPALVPILWGPNWSGVVPLLEVLAIAGIAQAASVSTTWVLQSQGRTRLMFGLGALTAAIRVTGVAVGLAGGARGVAIGVLVASWIAMPIDLRVAGRVLGLPAWQLLRATGPLLGVAGLTGAGMWLAPVLLGLDRASWLALAVQVLVGMVVLAGSVRLLATSAYRDLLHAVRRRAL